MKVSYNMEGPESVGSGYKRPFRVLLPIKTVPIPDILTHRERVLNGHVLRAGHVCSEVMHKSLFRAASIRSEYHIQDPIFAHRVEVQAVPWTSLLHMA